MITKLKLTIVSIILLANSLTILGDPEELSSRILSDRTHEQDTENILPINATDITNALRTNTLATIPAIDQELANDQHLWEAVRRGNYSRTRELVERGANVHSTLLHTVSGRRHSLIDEAIQHTPLLQFASPFFRFCSRDRAKIFYLLRSRGACPEHFSNRILLAVKEHPSLCAWATVSIGSAIVLKTLGT